MKKESEISRLQYSENINVKSLPYVVFRIDGSSYLNKKAANILNVKDDDVLALYHTKDLKKWYLVNDVIGMTVKKRNGLYSFCGNPQIKKFFSSQEIKSKKAFFFLAEKTETIQGKVVLFIYPNPFNQA